MHRVYGASIAWKRNARGRRQVSSLRLRNFLTLLLFAFFFNKRGRFLEHEKLSFAIGGARVRILPDKLPGISNYINSREKLVGQAQKAEEWQHSASCFA